MKTIESVLLVSLSDFGLGRGLYLAEAFSKIGHNITVLTNYPVYSPKQYTRQKNPSNVKIVTFPSLSIPYNSIIGRLIFYFWIMLWSFFFFVKHNSRFDVIYLRPPHPFTDFAAMIYKMLNKKVVLISDITDLWPDALKYIEISDLLKVFLIRIGHLINQIVYAKLDLIITHNEIMASILKERSKKEVKIIYGAIDTDKFKPIDKKNTLEALPQELSSIVDGKFVVLYAGIMGTFQDPLVVADIAEQIQDECRDVVFAVVGSGPLKQELQKTVQIKSLNNVLILNAMPHELMPFIYNMADLTLLPPPMLSVPGMYEYFIPTLPKKFIEYAACGKPILCMTPPCIASKLCLEWNAGYHVLPQDIRKVVSVIKALKENKELKEQLGKNARQLAKELFSTESTAAVLKKVLGYKR